MPPACAPGLPEIVAVDLIYRLPCSCGAEATVNLSQVPADGEVQLPCGMVFPMRAADLPEPVRRYLEELTTEFRRRARLRAN